MLVLYSTLYSTVQYSTVQCSTACVQVLGVPVGYSSPNTMTDMSSAIKRGDKAANTFTRTLPPHQLRG